jgi:hypothetical protein
MKEQTAVEWLVEEINKLTGLTIQMDEPIIEQAKEREKEQIIEAYETAMETDIYNEPLKIGKDYYEQTFKSE